MSYPFLPISRMASATTGAFLSATRTTCGKAPGRMDGECTLILIPVTAVQSILLEAGRLLGPAIAGEACCTSCGPQSVFDPRREEIALEPRARQYRKTQSEGRSGGDPANLFKRRILDA